MKWDLKDIVIAIILSYIAVVTLNVLVSKVFPQIPIFQSGIALIMIMIAIILVMLFTFVRDGQFTMEEAKAMGIIILIMIFVFFVVKHYIPDLFSIVPNSLKQSFSFIP